MAETLVVVGSGPAAVSCAHALVSQGYAVTILDAGIELEPDRQQRVDRLRAQAPTDWDLRDLQMLREGSKATVGGVPVKRVYGSDFPYREVAAQLPMQAEHVTAFASLARGGLSNVWGAAVVPYRAEDIADWPVSAAELAPYYERVYGFMPLAAEHDDLEALFPLDAAAHQQQHLVPSPQAKALLDHLRRHQRTLAAHGFMWGRSRLAIQAAAGGGSLGCVSCGLCMYGCPHDAIYKSSHTLDRLVRADQVTYMKDIVVDALEETGGGVAIKAHDRRSGAALCFAADRVFVGAGALSSARIMLNSLPSRDVSLTMRDSQYFLLPLLGRYPAPSIEHVGAHTLAQIFIEVFDPQLGPHPVHLQVYTYNDLYTSAMKHLLGPLYGLARLPAGLALRRLMVIQGYLHSDLSSTASLTLRDGRMVVERQRQPAAARTVRKAVGKLRQHAGALGFVPISPMLKIGDPGQGAHIGGTFPMRAAPGPLESDTLGRPYGFTRVHLVDASVLPSIPSTTITVNVMANAYRIGSEWGRHGAA